MTPFYPPPDPTHGIGGRMLAGAGALVVALVLGLLAFGGPPW
jgi:hypothetical protein